MNVRFGLREPPAYRQRQNFELVFTVDADPACIRIPPPAMPHRADSLWTTTCFELFLRGDNETYVELNFSPSSQWAAYHFDRYRQGMRPLDIDPPNIIFSCDAGYPTLSVSVDIRTDVIRAAALSAVIEETDGTKSYWALRHPPGPPDFHHPDCFALALPAPGDA